MVLTTKYSIGDKVYTYSNDGVSPALTIGLVRAEIIDSQGVEDTMFDNFKPQKRVKNEYMCEETGIGSGYVYEESKVFPTQEQARVAFEQSASCRNPV